MAVKILMSLEGVDQVTAGFAEAQKAGEDMMRSITGLSDQDPLKGFSLSVGSATQAMTEHGRSVNGITEAYHILNPLLREVGVSFGNLREFAALGRISLEAAAGVVSGILVVALSNLEETAARTKASLSSLFGSQDLGAKAFDTLKQGAADLNTTVDGLAPAFKAATEALQAFAQAGSGVKFVALQGVDLPQGIAGNIKDTAAAVENLVKIIRTSGDTEAEAEKSATAFFTTLKNGGKLTADALKEFDPGVVQLLAQALGKGAESAQQFIAQVKLAPIPITQIIAALARFGPQAQTAFDAEAVKSFHDELSGLFHDLQNAFTGLTGVSFSKFLIDQFAGIRAGIQTTIAEINRIKQAIKDFDSAVSNLPGVNLLVQALNKISGAGDAAAKAASDAATKSLPGFKSVGDALGETFKSVPEAAGAAANQIPAAVAPGLQGTTEVISAARAEWVRITGQPIKPKFDPADTTELDAVIAAAKKTWGQLETDATQAGIDVNTGINTGLQQNPADFSAIVTAFSQTGSQLATIAQTIWDNLKSILSQVIVVPVQASTEGAAPQFARGGLVAGPGTGTSDSIMAMLSNREFIVNARSTEFYGPGFFAALNAMLVPRDLLPGFAMGGLVKAIASTPGQSARTPIVLNIDRHTFNMTATDDVASALQTLSVSEQMSAAGRSPGWRRS